MKRKILILTGSYKQEGNTSFLVKWFCEGAESCGADIEVINASHLKYKSTGCTSCRMCQKRDKYECVIDDDANPVLSRMAEVDVIVIATPLYFFSASAQIKNVFDRMFSLYKWDNEANTVETPLKGKTFVVLASAYEDIGLDVLAQPFKLTADYTKMDYHALLIPDAGVSGDIKNNNDAREKAFKLGESVAS